MIFIAALIRSIIASAIVVGMFTALMSVGGTRLDSTLALFLGTLCGSMGFQPWFRWEIRQ